MKVKGVKISVGDCVYIRWEDHYGVSNGGWMDDDKVTIAPLVCETVGWIVKQNKKRLATVHSHDGQFPKPGVSASYSVCPLRVITSIKVIQKNKRIKW